MSKRPLTNTDLLMADLSSTEMALYEVRLNLDHYQAEHARLLQKIEMIKSELKRQPKQEFKSENN